MLTVGLFTIANIWKQLKCLLIDEWIHKCYIHIYNGVLVTHRRIK